MNRRKERREAILLIIVSAIFVIGGTGVRLGLGQPVGGIGVLFFGACLVAGIVMLIGADSAAGRALTIVARFGLALAGAVFVALTPAGVYLGSPGRSQLVWARPPARWGSCFSAAAAVVCCCLSGSCGETNSVIFVAVPAARRNSAATPEPMREADVFVAAPALRVSVPA